MFLYIFGIISGNVLKIQHLLHICSEHHETADKEETSSRSERSKTDSKNAKEKQEEREKDLSGRQAVAVLGIALISMGEDIGSDMAFRTFGHLVCVIYYLSLMNF